MHFCSLVCVATPHKASYNSFDHPLTSGRSVRTSPPGTINAQVFHLYVVSFHTLITVWCGNPRDQDFYFIDFPRSILLNSIKSLLQLHNLFFYSLIILSYYTVHQCFMSIFPIYTILDNSIIQTTSRLTDTINISPQVTLSQLILVASCFPAIAELYSSMHFISKASPLILPTPHATGLAICIIA